MNPAKMFHDPDADLNTLKGQRIAVLGLGSQGFAHAQNLHDSGLDVIVGLRPDSTSHQKAQAAGLRATSISEAVKGASLISFLVPDMPMAQIYEQEVLPHLQKNSCLLFAHGFNVHFKQITIPDSMDVMMVAPKGPGNLVRETYLNKIGIPCLVAVEQDASGKALDRALAYAKGIGGTRAGVLLTTFKEETETDLFGEQAVLCGGTVSLIQAGFETLVEAGYQPEAAYFECLHELKLIVDLIQREGVTGMRQAISETAKYGDVTRGSRVIGDSSRLAMKEILQEIQKGTFANEWINEYKQGMPNYKSHLSEFQDHPLEKVGHFLRSKMNWLKTKPSNEGLQKKAR